MEYTVKFLEAAETAYLTNLLTTSVLHNLSHLSASNVLTAQPNLTRIARTRVAPPQERYTGLINWRGPQEKRYICPGIGSVLKGSLTTVIGKSIYTAHEGDCLIFPADIPHREYCLPSRDPFHLLAFTFEPPWTIVECQYSREKDTTFRIYRTHADLPQEIVREARSALTAHVRLESLRYSILRLLTWWLELLKTATDTVSVHSHPIVEQILAILEQADPKLLSVAFLASRLGASRSHISRVFHSATGRTLHQAIQETRVERAKKYLADAALPIKEIAYVLGFSDPVHFAHSFRRLAGTSPHAFRQGVRSRDEAADSNAR